MSNQVQHEAEDKTIEKAVWHYVGVTVLWLSLFLFGVVLERLGITASILPESIFSGETGTLRETLTECQRDFEQVKYDRDICKRTEDTLSHQIKELKQKLDATGTPTP